MQGIRSITPQYGYRPLAFAEGGLASLPPMQDMPQPMQGGTPPMQGGLSSRQGMPPPMQEPPAPEGLQLDAVLQQVSANLPEPLVEALKQIAAQIATLPPEEIQSFLETLDYLEQNKDRYQEAVQEMVAAGKIPPDSAPPQYDAALFSAIREVVSAAMNSAPMPAPQMPMEPPMGFARGGIAQLASQGRFGDNMLARINPQQANMLRARGGAGTINPRTGLREYFNLWKTLAPIVGAVAGAFLPFGSVIGPAVGSFAASKLAGNSTKDARVWQVTVQVILWRLPQVAMVGQPFQGALGQV